MTAALHPDYTAELALFGQLVGEWKVAHRSRTRGGAWTDSQRTSIFSWALDGLAVESILLDADRVEIGATMQEFQRDTADTFEWDGWVADDVDGPNWEQEQHLVATSASRRTRPTAPAAARATG